MNAIYHIDLQGLVLAIDKLLPQLPYPLSEVLEAKAVLKHLLAISIGYQDRRRLVDTELGAELYAAQMIPYQIETFIADALKVVEAILYEYGQLRLHHSNHTYELGAWLVVYETAGVKANTKYITQAEQTDYHRRIQREDELDREREEAYASEYDRYSQGHYQFR